MTNILNLRHLVLAVAALICMLPHAKVQSSPLDWITGEKIDGSGKIQKQTRELAHFTGVSLSLPGQLEIRIGTTENIVIETDDNILPHIQTVIEDGVLKLRPLKKNTDFRTRTLKMIVTARSVDRIALGGSGSVDADLLRGDKLRFDLGGSGSINLKGIEGKSAVVTVGGSGRLQSGPGSVDKVSISIGGSGDVDLGRVKSQEASVSVAGSGRTTVWASTTLSASIAGSGGVNYYGNPKTSKTVAGSGGLNRLGDAP